MRTIEAGIKIAKSQGLNEREQYLFADALTHEYEINMCGVKDCEGFLNAMEDEAVCKAPDNYIVGNVKENTRNPTVIVSQERLPKEFYGKEVEIRLKEVPKKEESFILEGYLMSETITISPMKFFRKKVRVTVEEIE